MNNLAMLAAIDKDRFDPRRRAFVLLRSGLRLDLLNPDPHAWTDEDLAAGWARTLRWGGPPDGLLVLRVLVRGPCWQPVADVDGGLQAALERAERLATPIASRRSFRSLPCRALSDLEFAHKLARVCGGEVIDTAVDRNG
jgi:hypothetical protein